MLTVAAAFYFSSTYIVLLKRILLQEQFWVTKKQIRPSDEDRRPHDLHRHSLTHVKFRERCIYNLHPSSFEAPDPCFGSSGREPLMRSPDFANSFGFISHTHLVKSP